MAQLNQRSQAQLQCVLTFLRGAGQLAQLYGTGNVLLCTMAAAAAASSSDPSVLYKADMCSRQMRVAAIQPAMTCLRDWVEQQRASLSPAAQELVKKHMDHYCAAPDKQDKELPMLLKAVDCDDDAACSMFKVLVQALLHMEQGAPLASFLSFCLAQLQDMLQKKLPAIIIPSTSSRLVFSGIDLRPHLDSLWNVSLYLNCAIRCEGPCGKLRSLLLRSALLIDDELFVVRMRDQVSRQQEGC